MRLASLDLRSYHQVVSDIGEHEPYDEEPEWYPDVTDDALRPRYTSSGIEYYVQSDGVIWLNSVTFPAEGG